MLRGWLHPSAIVTGAAGGRVIGTLKRAFVRRLYNHLARAYPISDWTCMNYGYAPLPGEVWTGPSDGDYDEQRGLDLYWRIATSGPRGAALEGLDLLEIGSGRGGGAAFVARTLAPSHLTGVDFAAASATLANERYGSQSNLSFAQGDAEALALAGSAFDVVLNIESAHCYASVPRFLDGAARVLRPGGALLFAGFASRTGGAYERLVDALGGCPLDLVRIDDITPNILASLRMDETRKRALIAKTLGPWMKSFATGAYAMEGTAMRTALEAGETAYIAAVLVKPNG
jgi:ubiquinone/menaquinone biosynthesis C-methylase UbiE